jgi:hypothetical protein
VAACTAAVGGAFCGPAWFKTPNEFPIFHSFLQLSNQFKLAKYENVTSRTQKISKLCVVRQHSFLAQLLNPYGFWIKKSRSKSNLKLVWILKGFKPLRKHSKNSPKIILDMTFMNMNLDW